MPQDPIQDRGMIWPAAPTLPSSLGSNGSIWAHASSVSSYRLGITHQLANDNTVPHQGKNRFPEPPETP